MDIKSRRLELGLSLDEVAKKVGVSIATVSRWETGEIANMRRDRIAALAKVLEVKPTTIMGVDEDISENEPDSYYFDPEVAKMAEELKNNPQYRVLFDASRKVSKEDMEVIIDLIKRMAKEDDTHHIE